MWARRCFEEEIRAFHGRLLPTKSPKAVPGEQRSSFAEDGRGTEAQPRVGHQQCPGGTDDF